MKKNVSHEEKTAAELVKEHNKLLEKNKRLKKEVENVRLELAKALGTKPSELDKFIKKLEELSKKRKSPWKTKLALFNLVKNLEMGEPQPLKEKRINCLLQTRLYNELAKKSMKEYKKTTMEAFSKN